MNERTFVLAAISQLLGVFCAMDEVNGVALLQKSFRELQPSKFPPGHEKDYIIAAARWILKQEENR